MKHTFTFLFTLYVASLHAQPTITSSVLPVKGDTVLMAYDSTLVAPGASGANATWDFSASVHQDLPVQRIYLDPSNTAYASKFPNAKLCRTDGIGAVYSYWDNTNTTKSVYYGFVEPGVYDQHYNNLPISYYKFPVNYNDHFIDSISAVTNPGSIVGPGKYYFDADGWGTLKLPHKTVTNALRTKSVVYIGDSMPPVNSYSLTTEYAWYEPAHKEPLLVISSVVINHAMHRKFVLYDNGFPSGINELLVGSKMHAWPNPASSRLFVELPGTLQKSEIRLLDAVGKTVLVSSLEGGNVAEVNLEGLCNGVYLMQVQSGDRFETSRIVKN
jgi:hypothetical protein